MAAHAPTVGRAASQRTTPAGYVFAAPFLLLFTLFMAVPIVASFLMSFTSFGRADLANPLGASVVGLANYAALVSDQTFIQAAINTVLFTVLGVLATLALGL